MKRFFKELNSFYPEYLNAHNDTRNRVLHFVGATSFFVLGIMAFILPNYFLLAAAILAGYLLPGLGHRYFQKNSSFRATKPVLCVLCAFRMYLETFLIPFSKRKVV